MAEKIIELDFKCVPLDIDYTLNNNYCQTIKYAKWNYLKWKGLCLMKDPMTLTIYLQLIQDLKPKTILEFGTFDGGGALWMADMCRSLNLDTHVYTYDNNIERVKCLDERVTVINLDVTMIDSYTYNNRSFFENLPKPLLIIEDCHVNTFNICKSMDKIMKAGDYLVIEDTIDYSKHQEMIKFLENTTDYYVDRFYCDMWGNNNSWNVNSFLKKVK